MPDSQVLAAVKQLPAVTASHLTYVDQLGTSNAYRGYVELRQGLDLEQTTRALDHVLTILRHGHRNADLGDVQVQSSRVVVSPYTLGLGPDSSYKQTYDQRYGPQTGEKGWPPPFVPN